MSCAASWLGTLSSRCLSESGVLRRPRGMAQPVTLAQLLALKAFEIGQVGRRDIAMRAEYQRLARQAVDALLAQPQTAKRDRRLCFYALVQAELARDHDHNGAVEARRVARAHGGSIELDDCDDGEERPIDVYARIVDVTTGRVRSSSFGDPMDGMTASRIRSGNESLAWWDDRVSRVYSAAGVDPRHLTWGAARFLHPRQTLPKIMRRHGLLPRPAQPMSALATERQGATGGFVS